MSNQFTKDELQIAEEIPGISEIDGQTAIYRCLHVAFLHTDGEPVGIAGVNVYRRLIVCRQMDKSPWG